ncbi:hypothetical protein ACLKA6_005842 [Drosophila palustris]
MPTDPKEKAAATSEMVTMPTDNAKEVGPRKPVFHPGLGVEGVILPPPITSGPKQSAISAAEVSVGAGTVGVTSTATSKKKFSFTERRSAGDILQRHHNNAGSNLSEDWLRKRLRWPRDSGLRRHLLQAPGRSFAQIAKERILIVVLDRGNPDGRIPRNQWRWIESALAIQCFELLEKEPGPPPVCKDVGWYQGTVKVIACDDSRSAELYRAAVANSVQGRGCGSRPEMDGYMSDASSLTRDLRKLWQTGDLEVTSDIASDDEDANLTVVEANPVDVTRASTVKPPPL